VRRTNAELAGVVEVDGAPTGPIRLAVDELAQITGTTTRNVRAFQTLGLLAPPHLAGRRGYYDRDHLQRLRAILRLQRQGFSLLAIGVLLDAWQRGATLEQVLGLPEAGAEDSLDADTLYAFGDWRPGAGQVIALVPSTMLGRPLAS
jgi:DNA-binding transcriptional MerR regulator